MWEPSVFAAKARKEHTRQQSTLRTSDAKNNEPIYCSWKAVATPVLLFCGKPIAAPRPGGSPFLDVSARMMWKLHYKFAPYTSRTSAMRDTLIERLWQQPDAQETHEPQ
jgi:hypothetical protein